MTQRTITTILGLNTLPDGTVVEDQVGNLWKKQSYPTEIRWYPLTGWGSFLTAKELKPRGPFTTTIQDAAA